MGPVPGNRWEHTVGVQPWVGRNLPGYITCYHVDSFSHSWERRSESRGARSEKSARPQPKSAPKEPSESPTSSPLPDFLTLDSQMEALNDLSDYLNKVEDEGTRKKEETEDPPEANSPVPAWIRCSPADLYFRRHHEVSISQALILKQMFSTLTKHHCHTQMCFLNA